MSSLKVELDVGRRRRDATAPVISRKDLSKKTTRPTVVKPKTPLQRVFGNKTDAKNHYFTAGFKINDANERDVLHEPSPFKYPKDLELFAYKAMSTLWSETMRATEQKWKYNERNNSRSRKNLDILNRLRVRSPTSRGVKTILDVDPDFFTVVQGRPIQEKFSVSNYVADLRDSLRARVITGCREDEIALIEENFAQEQKAINEIKHEYQKYADAFEEFLSHDHSTSMDLLRQAEREAGRAYEMYEIFKELSKDYGALRAQVYNLEEKWRNCKLYQKFLYLVSPMHWRKKYDYYHLKMTKTHLSLTESRSSIFEKYKQGSESTTSSLEAMVEEFLDECNTDQEPLLYFKEPWELLKVFRFLELQNLNSLLHSEELAIPLHNVKETMREAKEKFDEQINSIQETIDNISDEILWEEERARTLEQLAMKLINGDFQKLISDEQILSLYVFVEDVYETRIAPNDANLSVCDMMRAIEKTYRNFLIQFDQLPQDRVRKAESECYAEEARILHMAMDAAKKVLQVERLTKRLKRILEPPFVRDRKVVPKRSPPLKKPKSLAKVANKLTPDETEYLTYFTDYCPFTNNIANYEIDENLNDLVRKQK